MPLKMVSFEEAHLDIAAALLAVDQKRRRGLQPMLAPAFEAAEEARKPLEELFRTAGASGVVAERDGRVVGFLLAMPRLPDRIMVLPIHGYALDPSETPETYRELYAAFAEDWVRRGFFRHSIAVLDADRLLRDCWDSLGFGRFLTAAVRDVSEPVRDAPELDIRQLGPEHIDVIAELETANARHHNISPIFVPFLPEDRDGYRIRTQPELENSANAHFVAYEDGEPAGMNTFSTEARHSPLVTPEGDVYLFQGVVYEQYRHAGIGRALLSHSMRWAREQGYSTCTLHYFPMNVIGARFWTANGFRPFMHILSRRIDERIAWARPDIQVP